MGEEEPFWFDDICESEIEEVTHWMKISKAIHWAPTVLTFTLKQLTMDTYSHMIPELRNEVADRMDEVFSTPTKSARVAVN